MKVSMLSLLALMLALPSWCSRARLSATDVVAGRERQQREQHGGHVEEPAISRPRLTRKNAQSLVQMEETEALSDGESGENTGCSTLACNVAQTAGYDDEKTAISRERWTMSKHMLGKGSFGIVYDAQDSTDPDADTVAVKFISKSSLQKAGMSSVPPAEEIRMQKKVSDHPRVVKLLDVYPDQEPGQGLNIVMEKVHGKEIDGRLRFDLIDELMDLGAFDNQRAKHVFQQMADAVLYCHSQGIAHRDLKPENIFLDRTSAGDDVKIGDFGLSYEKKGTMGWMTNGNVGTVTYMAPEVVKCQFQRCQYNAAQADLWSLGATLFVMVAGSFPWQAEEDQDIRREILAYKGIENQDSYRNFKQGASGNEALIDLVKSLLNNNPAKRSLGNVDETGTFVSGWLKGFQLHSEQSDVELRKALGENAPDTAADPYYNIYSPENM